MITGIDYPILKKLIEKWSTGGGGGGSIPDSVIARIVDLEADSHTHTNKTILDGITAEKITAWDLATGGGDVDLTAYYKKTETYSKTEVNDLLDDKADSADVYLKTDIDAEFGKYTTTTDLEADYVKDADFETFKTDISADTIKQDIIDMKADILLKSDKTYVDTELGKKVDKTDYDTFKTTTETDIQANTDKFADYTTTTDMNTALDLKADKTTTYTKTECDDKFATIVDFDALEVKVDTDIQNLEDNYYDKTEVDEMLENGNKTVLVNSGDMTLNGEVYEATITHGLGSEDIHVTAIDNLKNGYSMGFTVIDGNSIKIKSEAQFAGKIIVSAKFYQTTQTLDAVNVAKILENENNIAELQDSLDGHKFKWLTQAEYDALSEAEKEDVTIEYHITDAVETGHNHANKAVLDGIDQLDIDNWNRSGADIADILSKWVTVTALGTALSEYTTTVDMNEYVQDEIGNVTNDLTTNYSTTTEIETLIDTGIDNKEALKTTDVDGSTLTLTTDKNQIATIPNNTTIALPTVTTFTEIRLFFNTTADLNIIFPAVKWQGGAPEIKADKKYEIIFTYVDEWIAGVVVYE